MVQIGTDFKASKLWEARNFGSQFTTPVLHDGHLYGVTGNTHGAEKKELVCMEFATGAVKWTQGGFHCGSVTAAGDRLIVLGEKGELAVAKASPDGFQEISRAQITNGKCWTVPVLSGGRIYTRNAAGKMVVVDVRG